jgi:hypothetical protein
LHIQVPESRKVVRRKRLLTQVGQTLTQAAFWTGVFLTQPLVVTLRTLRPAVTHIIGNEARAGTTTAVQTDTPDVLASTFIFPMDTSL